MANLLHAPPLSLSGSEQPLSRSFHQAMRDIAERAQHLNNSDLVEEEAYLLWVMGRLMMVDVISYPDQKLFESHPQGTGVSVCRQRFGQVEFCYLNFDPDGFIPFHDHANCNGVMRVLEGEVTTFNL